MHEGAEWTERSIIARPFAGLRCCGTVMETHHFEGAGSRPEIEGERLHSGKSPVLLLTFFFG